VGTGWSADSAAVIASAERHSVRAQAGTRAYDVCPGPVANVIRRERSV